MDLTLDGAQLKELGEALCSAFPSRDKLKKFLRYELDLPLDRIAAESGLETTVAEILEEAEAKGWLVLLLRRACRESPANPILQRLEKELLQIFTTEQLQPLMKVAENAPWDSKQLEELAKESAPPDWLFPQPLSVEKRPATTFVRLVDSLSSAARQTDGSHPLVTFITRLARIAGEPTASELRKWLQGSGGMLPNPSSNNQPRSVHALRLFVKCESKKLDDGLAEDEIFVTAWLWSMDEIQKPLSSVPEPVLERTQSTVGGLPELLAKVLQSPRVTLPLYQARDRMTIEVCLRHKLLSQDVDAWPLTTGEEEEEEDTVRLGFQYPVVVRPYERLYEAQWRGWGLWRNKWEQLKQLQSLSEVVPPSVEWLLSKNVGDNLAERIGHPSILCVAIPERCDAKLLRQSIKAGTPAVLTLRQEGVPPEEGKSYLKKLLAGRPIELPERVHKARQEPKKPLVLEEHITLLWDDPDRLPPDTGETSVLTAPTVG
jgi:vWA-MoxR associated protein C-terminal domain/Effector-associated domain 1